MKSMNQLAKWTCTSWMSLLLAAGVAFAQKPMSLVDLLNVPSLSQPRLSPQGDRLVYQLSESDWEENKQVPHLWLIDLKSQSSTQLTNGKNGESQPRWSPDGRWIAFLAKRNEDKETQIYLIAGDGGEARRLSKQETDVNELEWSADGSLLYFLGRDPKSEKEKERDKLKDDVFAFDENFQQRHLWKISVPDGKATKLTSGEYSVSDFDLSADGKTIVYQKAPTPLLDDSDESEIWIMEAAGGNPRRLTENQIQESDARLSPDGSRVLFVAGTNAGFEAYFNRNLFWVESKGGKAVPILPDFPYEVQSARWSAKGDSIYALANMGVHSELFEIETGSHKYRQLTDGEHSVSDWSYDPRSSLHIFSIEDAANAGDVWILRGQGKPEQITHVFDLLSREFQLPRQEKVEWKGADGQSVEGLLIYPLDYEKGKRYPLVVQTHGGPAASDKFGFGTGTSRYTPVLAAKGYAVLKPNYRGSTGYGNDFLRDMVGHYFQQAHLDVMAGVDHVIGMGIADPDHLIKMGWSAGGHMTNKIITFTDRFKAASSGAGAVNWISMYGQSDVRIYRTPWFGGTPWQKDAPFEVYWENSPLKDISKVKTPTLILVGENDVRVPSPQSVELYRALKSNGVPTRLYIAPREPHGWRELRHRLFKMNVELEWFAKYALGQDYTWETAPGKAKTNKEETPAEVTNQ